jgi:hypothetical protein
LASFRNVPSAPGSRRGELAGRQAARPGILGHDLARLDLGRLHVGLVEWIDAQEVAGNGRGHLPQEELPADVVEVGQAQRDNRVSGVGQRGHEGVSLVASPSSRTWTNSRSAP